MSKDKSWRTIFKSMKTGLYLVMAISAASMAGTIIPQQPLPDSKGWLGQIMQLNDLYHSWWYIALLCLLTLNLIVCSFYRIKTIKATLKKTKRLLEIEELNKLKTHTSIMFVGEPDKVKTSILSVLAGYGYELWSDSSDGKLRIGAQCGRFGVLGSFITHLSLVIIMTGILAGVIFGYQGSIDVPVGTTFNPASIIGSKANIAQHSLKVKADKFWIERYANGEPSGYYSRLTILENDQPVQTKVIAVNSPLNYKGVKFYQARYGSAVTVQVNGPDGRTVSRGLIKEGDRLRVPNTNLTILVYRLITDPDFTNTKSSNTDSPRAIYVLYEDSRQIGMGAGEFGSTIDLGNQGYTFKFVKSVPYTGLQIKKDPGVPLIWLGSLLMLLGMGLSFFLQPRYLWLVAEQQGNLMMVSVGGKTNKNQWAWADHINHIAGEIQSRSQRLS